MPPETQKEGQNKTPRFKAHRILHRMILVWLLLQRNVHAKLSHKLEVWKREHHLGFHSSHVDDVGVLWEAADNASRIVLQDQAESPIDRSSFETLGLPMSAFLRSANQDLPEYAWIHALESCVSELSFAIADTQISSLKSAEDFCHNESECDRMLREIIEHLPESTRRAMYLEAIIIFLDSAYEMPSVTITGAKYKAKGWQLASFVRQSLDFLKL